MTTQNQSNWHIVVKQYFDAIDRDLMKGKNHTCLEYKDYVNHQRNIDLVDRINVVNSFCKSHGKV